MDKQLLQRLNGTLQYKKDKRTLQLARLLKRGVPESDLRDAVEAIEDPPESWYLAGSKGALDDSNTLSAKIQKLARQMSTCSVDDEGLALAAELFSLAARDHCDRDSWEKISTLESEFEERITPPPQFREELGLHVFFVMPAGDRRKVEYWSSLHLTPVVIPQIAAACQILRVSHKEYPDGRPIDIYRILGITPAQITKWSRADKPVVPRQSTIRWLVRLLESYGVSLSQDYGLIVDADALGINGDRSSIRRFNQSNRGEC